jgi:hypothetical protein
MFEVEQIVDNNKRGHFCLSNNQLELCIIFNNLLNFKHISIVLLIK